MAIPYNFVNDLVLEQLIPAVEAEPSLQPIKDPIIEFFRTYQPDGFTGNLVGINVFNGQPLMELEPTGGPTLTTQNTFEVGYKGLLSDRLGVSLDVYRINSKGSRGFGPIAPVMQLRNYDIPNDLGNKVGADFNTFLLELLTPTVGDAIAGVLAGQLTPLIVDAYRQGGEGFLAAVPAPLLNDIFGAVETSRMPQGDGIVHAPIGLRANPDFTSNRWGLDLATEYHFNEKVSVWANYSWVGDVESKADDSPTAELVLGTLGNTPNHKYRFGVVYLPDNGFRANLSFQHNDGFTANAGQFSGEVPAQNLVDASFGYQFANGISLDLTATNLFDTKYRAMPMMPILGRRIIAKATYSFGQPEEE